MRTIKKIVIHCTGTQADATIESIKNYWKNELKWKNVGYHFIIDRFGNITQLANFEQFTNGAAGYNKESIHIAYIGGIYRKNEYIDTRTLKQKYALNMLITSICDVYKNIEILGHNQLPNIKKACPCFDARKEYSILTKYNNQ